MTTTFKKALSWLLSILLVAFLVPIAVPTVSFAGEKDLQDESAVNEGITGNEHSNDQDEIELSDQEAKKEELLLDSEKGEQDSVQ